MTASATMAAPTKLTRFLPLLLILFAGSGCSALIYEIVWYQLLQLAIGSTSICLGILLATFMGGLCIGSLALPRFMKQGQHPLRVYALLEIGIAVFGVLVLWGMPLIDRIYVSGAQTGMAGMLMRGLIAAIAMLPPTILMGASLPAIVRWIESTPRGVAWWGLLYGGNTAGAVLGCLFAGFYLLRLYNMAVATYAAVLINLLVAALSFLMAARTPASAALGESELEAAPAPAAHLSASGPNAVVYLAIAISGATALGAEVVWTRLFGMLLGATVYAFSIILAVFLIGLGLGSGFASMLVRRVNARAALGWCQLLLAAGIFWTAYMIADSLPYWPINPLLVTSPWFTMQIDLVRCLWAILPPALLWGASFPLAFASVTSSGDDPGANVGRVYAANTAGAIVGALTVSLILIPGIGTQNSQRLMLLLAALGGLVVLLPYLLRYSKKLQMIGVAAACLVAVVLAIKLDKIPGELVAYGRKMAISYGSSHILAVVEGRNSSIAYSRWADGATEVDVNGHVEATTEPYDMKLQRMVGHLPALLHPNPKSVLGIGFGAGVSAGTFTRYPGIEHITVCEIEPQIPPNSTKYFTEADYDVKDNPRTHIVFDDARHYMLTTHNTYDVIASDPLDVFVKGTAAIYSKEYFESIKRHLNPGGYFSLYVPLYESDQRTVKSELATFFDVFPNATVWGNTINGAGYDLVVMGQVDPLRVNLDEVQARLDRPDYGPVADSLREIGVGNAAQLFSTYAGQQADLGKWFAGAELNRDADLRLQYIGGWGINSTLEDVIWREMLSYRRRPVNIFTGSPQQMQALVYGLAATNGSGNGGAGGQ